MHSPPLPFTPGHHEAQQRQHQPWSPLSPSHNGGAAAYAASPMASPAAYATTPGASPHSAYAAAASPMAFASPAHAAASPAVHSSSSAAGARPAWAAPLPAAQGIDATDYSSLLNSRTQAAHASPASDSSWSPRLQQETSLAGLHQRRGMSVTTGDAGGTSRQGGGAAVPSSPFQALSLQAAAKAPLTLQTFFKQLLTWRLLTLLGVLWLLASLAAIPYLLYVRESAPPLPPLTVHPFRCEPPLVQVHHDCVGATPVNLRAVSMKEAAIEALRIHAGLYHCGERQQGTPGLCPGADSADLTLAELTKMVLEPEEARSPISERNVIEHAWKLVRDRWLADEATHLSMWNPLDPEQRLLLVHTDSRQMPRYRAVFPRKSLQCKLRDQALQHPFAAIWLGLRVTLALTLLWALKFLVRFVVHTWRLRSRLLALVKSDSFYDYDRRRRVYQAQAVPPLRAEHMEQARGKLGARPWRLVKEMDSLFQSLVWQVAQRQIDIHPHVESAPHTFQYGVAPSWKWCGPAPSAAEEAEFEAARKAAEREELERDVVQVPRALNEPSASRRAPLASPQQQTQGRKTASNGSHLPEHADWDSKQL